MYTNVFFNASQNVLSFVKILIQFVIPLNSIAECPFQFVNEITKEYTIGISVKARKPITHGAINNQEYFAFLYSSFLFFFMPVPVPLFFLSMFAQRVRFWRPLIISIVSQSVTIGCKDGRSLCIKIRNHIINCHTSCKNALIIRFCEIINFSKCSQIEKRNCII